MLSDSSLKEELPEPPTTVTSTSFNISLHAVRNDEIIGYRVYEKDSRTGEMKKVKTVSLFDRKKVEIRSEVCLLVGKMTGSYLFKRLIQLNVFIIT